MKLKEIKPGMVIHCKTEEEAVALHTELCRIGNMSTDMDNLSNFIDVSYLCYEILNLNTKTWRFATEHEFEEKNGIEFSDLIIPELSAKEVLETMKEICDFVAECKVCPFVGECDPTCTPFDVEKTVEICTEWRNKHPKEEKRKLETEWVNVVRIIKVHTNGKKECVHEVDLFVCSDDVAIPYHEIEESAERELKDYVANHKGNYFATLEHICRIKE